MSQLSEQITKPTIIEPALKLDWGMTADVPAGVKLAWGARAIYSIRTSETPQKRRGGKVVQRAQSKTIASIDIPYDRQSGDAADDITPHDRKVFTAWINNKGLPALKRWCERYYVTGDSDEKFELVDSGYALVALPRASYGYLYIAAWVVPPGGLGDASEAE